MWCESIRWPGVEVVKVGVIGCESEVLGVYWGSI